MKIKRENVINLLLFLIGFFCQISPLLSRTVMISYLAVCFFLFVIAIDYKKNRLGLGFLWYSIFTFFCLLTLGYTVNKINPDYVYIRVITYLLLLLLSVPFLMKDKSFKKLILGFIVGGIIGITIVLINQHNLIGVKRLGGNIYGSYAEFGNVCMITLASFIWLKDDLFNKKIIKLFIFLFISLAIVLSGARKAILVPIMMVLFLQLFDRRKKIGKKVIFLLFIATISVLLTYVSLNNKYMYGFVGYRIESGINSFMGEEKSDASIYERDSFKRLAKKMFFEKPVIGWGIHGFAIKNYYLHNNTKKFLLYSHDGFLEILSCYGIVGFALFYWPFVYVLANWKKLAYDDMGIFLLSFMAIIIIMEPFSISFLCSYYIILIGTSINLIRTRRKTDEKNDCMYIENIT